MTRLPLPDADAHDEDGYTIVSVGNSLPVSELLDRMIVDSNNTAGLMLLFQVRAARLKYSGRPRLYPVRLQ